MPRRILANGWPLIEGGAPEGDDDASTDDGAGGDSGAATATADDAGGIATGTDENAGDGAGGRHSDDGEDDSLARMTPKEMAAELGKVRSELQRANRERNEMAKKQRKADAEAKLRDEKRREEQGQWKELAEERARENEQLRTQIAERDRRDAEREQRSRVEAIADRLQFKRPRRAYVLLRDEITEDQAFGETLEDDNLIEAALKRIARAEPEHVDQQRRSGAPGSGRGGQQATPAQGLTDTLLNLTGGRTR